MEQSCTKQAEMKEFVNQIKIKKLSKIIYHSNVARNKTFEEGTKGQRRKLRQDNKLF